MEPKNTRLQELIGTLEQVRDELALQIHLGGKEAREEWSRQEAKLAELKQQAQPYGEAVGETAVNLAAAAELAVGELHSGYRKIRELLNS